MGRIVNREVCYIARSIELTVEDVRKREERRLLKHKREIQPPATEHERRFMERLEKCPVCGGTPHLLKIMHDGGSASYKVDCSIACACKGNGFECGDWFDMLAMAGRDWNDRARRDRLQKAGRALYDSLWKYRDVLTRQQLRTLKGQIFAGDTDGAKRGLEKLLARDGGEKRGNKTDLV